MSTETSLAIGQPAAATELPRAGVRRRPDAANGPGRPLGPKAALLHARRSRIKPYRPASNTGIVLTSDDGSVSFLVTHQTHGLFIERTQRGLVGAQLSQSFLFEDLAAFIRWCEADATRFDQPLLYGRLRRQGDEHFWVHP